MSESWSHPRINLAPAARRDISGILKWSEKEFGEEARLRYEALLVQALRDIEADSERAESRQRDDLGRGVRVYHLRFSRTRVGKEVGEVYSPRHFVVYRRREQVIEVVRILHDSRDLARHVP